MFLCGTEMSAVESAILVYGEGLRDAPSTAQEQIPLLPFHLYPSIRFIIMAIEFISDTMVHIIEYRKKNIKVTRKHTNAQL